LNLLTFTTYTNRSKELGEFSSSYSSGSTSRRCPVVLVPLGTDNKLDKNEKNTAEDEGSPETTSLSNDPVGDHASQGTTPFTSDARPIALERPRATAAFTPGAVEENARVAGKPWYAATSHDSKTEKRMAVETPPSKRPISRIGKNLCWMTRHEAAYVRQNIRQSFFRPLREVSNRIAYHKNYILLICPDADERSTRSRRDKACNEEYGHLSLREVVLFAI
jgi:hypothetical protein